jgi:hypothetical protein
MACKQDTISIIQLPFVELPALSPLAHHGLLTVPVPPTSPALWPDFSPSCSFCRKRFPQTSSTAPLSHSHGLFT